MSIFAELAKRNIKCEVCDSPTIALYGNDWDNDRICCSDKDCGAEYVFPTSTQTEAEE